MKVIAGPAVESNAYDFSEKMEKKGQKGQNIWKFVQKCTEFENILIKGSLMYMTIAHLKQLEYALHGHVCFLYGYI